MPTVNNLMNLLIIPLFRTSSGSLLLERFIQHYKTICEMNLLGCEIGQELNLSQAKFHIKLQIATSEGMTDLILKCDSVL